MYYFKIIIVIIVILFCTSCIDEEGKKMMLFVNQIVEEPYRMQEIIESSKYYHNNISFLNENMTYDFYINKIEKYKEMGIKYHYFKDSGKILESGQKLTGSNVYIGTGNIDYDVFIGFFFQRIDNEWKLTHIFTVNGY